jgi:probable F420-dependent oxidoreductase
MKYGVVYPQNELPADPDILKSFALAVEDAGFDHLLTYEHVLGANPNRPGGWTGPYTFQDAFWDPFTMFSYLAGCGSTLEFVSAILILPQRQTALVAKQAACLDVLCQGRFRMGIGLGWNKVEYESLGEDFHNRGIRIEEQVEVLRQLWTDPLVSLSGRWHQIPDAGLNPMPVQRPIPLWFGGSEERAIRRMARLGDGWFPQARKVVDARIKLDFLRDELKSNGRDESKFGIEPRLPFTPERADDFRKNLEDWTREGASHICVNTIGMGYHSLVDHVKAIQAAGKTVGLV